MNPSIKFDPADIETSVIARFEAQVARNPAAIAVRDMKGALNYAELNRRANQVAHAILARRDAASEPIALLIEHSAAMVTAILAVLKTGKFYVPLDLAQPDARLAAIVQDSGAPLLITNGANRTRAENASNAIQLLDVDALPPSLAETNPKIGIAPDALLNIMYTSGTTGEPKGVMQTRRNLQHLIVTTNFPPHRPDERVAQLTPFTFGGSAAMLFRTLYYGAAIYPYSLKELGLGQLAPFLKEHAITRFHTVPSVLRNWLDLVPPDETFPALRVVEVGGEPLFKRDLERLFLHLPKTCLVRNALGTTETYVAVWNWLDAVSELQEGVVPVGLPPPDMHALVMDETGQPVDAGETGEIVIRSRYLSPGYWKQPELTQKTFLPDPSQSGVLGYKTGDLGRLRQDGALEHLGRLDGMVKIRGQQVLLTFVESALRALQDIRDAAVMAQPNAAGDLTLVAYVVAANESARALRTALEPTLPAYMIPSNFVFMQQLPKLPNGKLDRRALPAPDSLSMVETRYVAPRTPLEAELAQIWCKVLGISRVGVRDTFIELGGNSLQAAQVVARASASAGVEIPLRAVFDVPTIEGLAAVITGRLAERVSSHDLEQWLREVETFDAPTPAA